MKNITLLMISLLLACHLSAQEEPQNVAGTKVFMIPPPGFVQAKNFVGFKKDGQTGINVMEIPRANFYRTTKDFNQEEFEAKGLRVLDYKDTIIDEYPAKLVKTQGDPYLKSLALIFGDSTFSVMIMVVYPVDDAALESQIENAILGATYDKNAKVDVFAHAFFRLDDSQTKLKFATYSGNMYVYTPGGKKEENANEPMLMVIPLPADTLMSPQKTSEDMIENYKGKGFLVQEYIKKAEVEVNGYQSYELIVKGTLRENNAIFYIQTILNQENQVVMQGIFRGDQSSFDPVIFQELIQTIEMK